LAFLLDTNVAIYLRESFPEILDRVDALPSKPFLCAVTRVELEGGVYAHEDEREHRRKAVDSLLRWLPMLDFDFDMAEVYGQILEKSGFSRRKIIDRMIAATAIVSNMTLITTNGDDFADIEGLKLDVWSV
jgi:tRNA(fMet)-specific endonuclease VapC